MKRIATIVMVILFFATIVYSGDVFVGNQKSPYTVAKIGPTTLTYGPTDILKTSTLTNTFGRINSAIVVMPKFAASVTAEFNITNEDGIVLFNQSVTPVTGKTYLIQTFTDLGFVPVYGGSTVGVTLGGEPGGTSTAVKITLYLQ